MRAIASTGTLVRPSVKLLEQQTHQSANALQRHISSRASVTSISSRFSSRAEVFATKEGEKEGFIGKIHDEELVEQQLEASHQRMIEQLYRGTREAANPFNTQLERSLSI